MALIKKYSAVCANSALWRRTSAAHGVFGSKLPNRPMRSREDHYGLAPSMAALHRGPERERESYIINSLSARLELRTFILKSESFKVKSESETVVYIFLTPSSFSWSLFINTNFSRGLLYRQSQTAAGGVVSWNFLHLLQSSLNVAARADYESQPA